MRAEILKRNKKMREYYNKNKEKIAEHHSFIKRLFPWKRVFQSIKYRCNNKKCKAYKYYGGRGIKCLI